MITDMVIREVSIVTFPVYAETDVGVARRSFLAAMPAGKSIDWLQKWHTLGRG